MIERGAAPYAELAQDEKPSCPAPLWGVPTAFLVRCRSAKAGHKNGSYSHDLETTTTEAPGHNLDTYSRQSQTEQKLS